MIQSPQTQTSPVVPETKHWGASFQISELKTFAYGSADDPQEYSSIVKTLWTRVWGTVKLIFGIAEVVAGVAAVKTGIGAPFGVLAIIHGLDTMYAGATQLVSGEETDTLTKRLANSAFLAHFKPATLEEKKELEKFGEGIDSLVGIVGGLGGAGALFKGAKQLKQGAGVAKAAAGHKAIDAASDVGSNLKKAAFSSKADDIGQSDMGTTFYSRDAWKGPFGGAKVRPGFRGQAHTGPPKFEPSDSWFGRLIGAKKVSYPNANYGVVKNLSAADFAAVTRHEQAHINFFRAYPEITHLAGRGVGTPGKGVASFIIEFHGNMAEHSGNIGKAFFGALLKDTEWVPLAMDGAYLTGLGLSGYYFWQRFNK
ncbi:MAG: hypothetical protein Q8M16_01200 [Pirellulaceae bacterium]|nr:hypothetical protein [Pirellulaceae bacterium]